MQPRVFLRNCLTVLLGAAAAILVSGQTSPFNKVQPRVVRDLLELHRKVEFVPGEIIVKKKVVAGITSEVPIQPLVQLGVEPTGNKTSGGEEIYHLTTQLLTALSTQDVKDRTVAAAKALQSRPEVEYAQPNFILHIVNTTPNDTRFSSQWHYLNRGTGSGNSPGGIGLPTVWDTNKGTSSMVVAVVDTGILPHHEDIEGSPNYIGGYDMVTDTARANDGDGRDPDPTDPGDAVAADECGLGTPALPSSWHGTHVAGTIGVGQTNNRLGVAGINWNVRVLAVRVLGKCGGTIVDINDGIRWAAGLPVAGVPNNTTPAKVINMSLGGPSPCSASPATQSAINDAVAAGATVVVAAGNDAQDAAGFFPASCDKVIAVAASDARGFLVQRYSNFGSTVKIMAPGGDVDRDDNGDGQPDGVLSMVQGGYAYYNGTSMAAPHVSGVVALMLAQDPTLTPAQILARLTATAVPRSATECPKPCGAGLLNAPGAVLNGPLLTLDPASMQLSKGKTGQITATLTQDGQAQPAQNITFASDNAGVASLNSSTAVTDANGRATVTATGNSAGQTTVHAQTATMSAQASVSVAVKTPDLSRWALVLAALLLLWFFYREARKFRKGVQPRYRVVRK